MLVKINNWNQKLIKIGEQKCNECGAIINNADIMVYIDENNNYYCWICKDKLTIEN